MNFRTYNLILASLLSLLAFSGCTLSMDEIADDPDVTVGKDEPVTVTNELGTFSYQFNDNVTLITEKAMEEYFVLQENDTTLIFRDDMPSIYIPRTGGVVAANPSETLPFGLGHRVVACERQGGRIRMVLTQAEVKEVFKSRKIDMSLDYYVPNEAGQTEGEADSTTRATNLPRIGRHIKKKANGDDSVFIDMRYIRGRSANGTRAQKTDLSTKDTVITKTYSGTINLGAIPGIKNKFGDVNMAVSVTTENVIYQKIIYKEDLERDWRYTMTIKDEHTDYTVGTTLDMAGQSDRVLGKDYWEDIKKNPEDLKYIMENLRETANQNNSKSKLNKSWTAGIPVIYIPLPALSMVCVVIDIDFNISVTPAMVGSVTVRVKQPQTTTISETENGKDRPNQLYDESSRNVRLTRWGAGGQLTIAGNAGIGVGIGVGGTGGGAALTANARAKVEATVAVPFAFSDTPNAKNSGGSTAYREYPLTQVEGVDNIYAQLSFELWCDLSVFVNVKGKKLGSAEIASTKHWKKVPFKITLGPTVKFGEFKVTHGYDETFYNASYKFTGTGYFFNDNLRSHARGYLRVYRGQYSESNTDYIMIWPKEKPYRIEANKEYEFSMTKKYLESYLGPSDTYTLVPVVSDNNYLPIARVYPDNTYTIGGDKKPKITLERETQTFGYYDGESENGPFNYEAMYQVKLTRGYLIKEWGFEYKFYRDSKVFKDKDGNEVGGTVYYKPGNTVKSGRYKAFFLFSTDYPKLSDKEKKEMEELMLKYTQGDNYKKKYYNITIRVRPFYVLNGSVEKVYSKWSTYFDMACPYSSDETYNGEYELFEL